MESDLSKAVCASCPYARRGQPIHKPVVGHGPADAKLIIVGEGPGKDEIFEGKPFVGPTGQLLRAICGSQGIDIDPDQVYLTNTVLCSTADGTKPPAEAVSSCRPRLLDELQKLPGDSLVLSLGAYAVKALLQTKDGITNLEGAIYSAPQIRQKVLPTFHPAAVLRGAEQYFENIYDAFKRAGLIMRGVPLPRVDIETLTVKEYWPGNAHEGIAEIALQVHKWATRSRSAEGELLDLAIDLETDSIEFMRDPVLQIGIYNKRTHTAWVFNVGGKVRNNDGTWVDGGELLLPESTKEALRKLLRDRRIRWWFHNKSFDIQFIRYWYGVHPREYNHDDTMCLALGATEKQQQVGLGVLARRWFNAPAYWHELETWLPKAREKRKFSMVPRDVLGKYLAHDCVYTWHLIEPLKQTAATEGTTALTAMLSRYQALFSQMEYRGVGVDLGYVDELRKIWRPHVAEAKQQLKEAARAYGFDARDVVKGKPKSLDLNPGSWKQLQHYFYTLRQFRPVFNQKRKLTTGKEFLKKYEHDPDVKKLVDYRTVKKMMSTYVDGIANITWADGRVHPDILVFGTRTGRLAIKRPPLQTIPKEDRLKIKFNSLRKLFIPLPLTFERYLDTSGVWLEAEGPYDSVLVEIDYKQLEMRIAWHYSEDEALGEALMSGDFHTYMAAKIFKVTQAEVTKAMRHTSKFVTFGVLYGRQAFSLAKGELNCGVAEAQVFIDNFFAAAPRLAQWWHDTQARAIDDGELTTTLGRKRRWPLITPANLQEVRNQSVNFPVQSLASDLNTLSAEQLYEDLERMRYGYPLFPVHDAILFEMRKDRLREGITHAKKVMCNPPFKTCAIFEVDVSVGPSWGETKEDKEA